MVVEIEKLIAKRARSRVWGRISSLWTSLWLRLFCFADWKALKTELIKIEMENHKD